ncbi:protein mono-ADP-ribosyltransferase PARP12-like [Ruditapes philippinarum]|uniref:protein mono-ADP-ribosyltransferase PARP12-like n=1 Tax=Ruditapes philippinarum TaxID=129788 RepID=UPI00295C1D2E|nr:protein mono-ADP-ribosyltransferase PARP12-like [Ruditapes philippinarum]
MSRRDFLPGSQTKRSEELNCKETDEDRGCHIPRPTRGNLCIIDDRVDISKKYKQQTTSPQGQRDPVRPIRAFDDKLMEPAIYHPPFMNIDPRCVNRIPRAQRYNKGDTQPTRRGRHSSAQIPSSNHALNRDRFRSAERDANCNRGHRQNVRDQGNAFQKRDISDIGENKTPTAEVVFSFMVKNMEGKGTMEDIRNKSRLFPPEVDISDWFRRNKSRFTLIERGDQITFIFVYDKRVTLCIHYSKKDSCKKTDCNRYHICKNVCAGKCIFGRRCNFSHDCFDEHNSKISNDLGFSDTLTSDEICIILRLSFPHVCSAWSFKGTCTDSNCPDLHICPGYILDKCQDGPTCSNIHDRNTEHNRAILEAFDMTGMSYRVFRWLVFMLHNPAYMRNERMTSSEAASQRQSIDSLIHEETEEAEEAFICVDYIFGQCRDRRCKCIHSKNKLPYIWQIHVFGAWISLNECEKIEEAYADHAEKSNNIKMPYNGLDLSVQVYFIPVIKADVIIHGSGESLVETKARRLSTMSYINAESSSLGNEEVNTNKFYTQWRWYWRDDYRQWNLFQPDVFQYTLEAKYLARQMFYSFSRENFAFNHTISFDKMVQLNNDTRKRRHIMRRPVLLSLEEVRRKIFPLSLSAVTLIKTPLPESWMPWDLVQPFELVNITGSNEEVEIKRLFFETIDRSKEQIDSICRVQNHKLWELFCSEESTMKDKARRLRYKHNSVNKKFLFHGTDNIDAVRGICVNNFDKRVSGKFGTSYGDGAYFARDAKYSHCYTQGPVRYMFVVNVLLGQSAKGDKSYRRPPEIPGRIYELYDSCVNDIEDPTIFVLFDKNLYYPQYLIQYHDRETISQETVSQSTSYSSF